MKNIADNFIRRVTNIRVIDGDTIEGDLLLGFSDALLEQDFRCYGVNAYETTRKGSWDDGLTEEDVAEKIRKGLLAKEELTKFVSVATGKGLSVFIESKVKPKVLKSRKEKYGRWLCVLWIEMNEGEFLNWNDHLLESGCGYKYMED